MRILHVVHAYPPSVGGCQHLVEQLSRRLVADFGDEVTVLTTVARHTDHFVRDDGAALPAGAEQRDGVTVRRFPVWNGLTRARMLAASVSFRFRLPGNERLRTLLNGPVVPGLAAAVAASGAEVVMASAFPLRHMYDALRGARRAGIPCVLLGALHVEDRWNYDRKMIFAAIRRADGYLALTEFERRHVIERGVAPQRVYVAGGGVDLEPFAAADGASVRRQLGIGDAPLVTTLSKQVPRKRFDLVLAAMERVWKSCPGAHLAIAGASTPYTPELERLVAASGGAGRVHLLSDLDEGEKAALLSASGVFVMASAEDSLGLVFLEAWACRLPVVGTSAGAIASLVADGEDGLLVPAGDAAALATALDRLLGDPELRRRLGGAGLRKVTERYSWAQATRQVRAVYARTMEERGSSGAMA